MMALFALLFWLLVLALLALVGLVWLIVLAGSLFGVFSVSVLYGFYTRSLNRGFAFFMVGGMAVGSALASIPIFWIGNQILHWTSAGEAILWASVTGLAAGAATGYLLVLVLRFLARKVRIP